MSRVIRNTLLNYLSDNSLIEEIVNSERIFDFNNQRIKKGSIVYLCEREIRAKDNFALQFCLLKSKELNLPLKIIHPKKKYEYIKKQKFIDNQVSQVHHVFQNQNIEFQIIDEQISVYLNKLDVAMLVFDFNPILDRNFLRIYDFKIYEIDGHNIVPARFVSDKQEYSASTLRNKIYHNINQYLTDFDNLISEKVEADFVLEDFIKNKLSYYAEFKNDPSKNVLSGLSKYLNLGFLSAQRVVLEVIKSNVSLKNKEAFLEEIIIRKELADNYCFYVKSFKDYSGIPNWAKVSLVKHEKDLRSHIYTLKDFEFCNTHDKLWNAIQFQLKNEGVIHGYLRMYWAKKILEWSISPKEALEIAIYLNDKYAYDSPSANGYVGILWSLGGLHDRAFVDYLVTGKIRRMTYSSIKKKYKLDSYLNKYLCFQA